MSELCNLLPHYAPVSACLLDAMIGLLSHVRVNAGRTTLALNLGSISAGGQSYFLNRMVPPPFLGLTESGSAS